MLGGRLGIDLRVRAIALCFLLDRTLMTFPPIRPVEPAIIEVITVISI